MTGSEAFSDSQTTPRPATPRTGLRRASATAAKSHSRHEHALFCRKCQIDDRVMQKSDIKEQCRRRFLELIAEYGLPEPDTVVLEEDAVRFMWSDRQVAVVINIEEFEEHDANHGFSRDGLPA